MYHGQSAYRTRQTRGQILGENGKPDKDPDTPTIAFLLWRGILGESASGVNCLTKPTGLLVPITVSVVSAVGWLIFILVHAAFWSEGFSLFQNIVIGVVSFLVATGLAGLVWVIWALRQGSLRE